MIDITTPPAMLDCVEYKIAPWNPNVLFYKSTKPNILDPTDFYKKIKPIDDSAKEETKQDLGELQFLKPMLVLFHCEIEHNRLYLFSCQEDLFLYDLTKKEIDY